MTIPCLLALLLLRVSPFSNKGNGHHMRRDRITDRCCFRDQTIYRSSSRHRNLKAQAEGSAEPGSKKSSSIDFLDCHHHFYDTRNNDFQSFLNRFLPEEAYLPLDYTRDVVVPICDSEALRRRRIRHIGSVHVESMPDDGLSEVRWVESLLSKDQSSTVKAIVASCDLADDAETVRRNLRLLTEASPKVRGIRWILDCVTDAGGQVLRPATHVGNLRHDGIDYLDPSGARSQEFRNGFALLQEFDLSFDLQCAPQQLLNAAELCSKHPNIPVVIDHIGKPMQILGANNAQMMPDETKLDEWRAGMTAMAALPHVYVKISGLGWAIPNWKASARRVDLVKRLCQETVELFGPNRCMIATNWFKDAASSDSDGVGDQGPSADEFLEFLLDWFGGLTLQEQGMLFAGTAQKFYKIQ